MVLVRHSHSLTPEQADTEQSPFWPSKYVEDRIHSQSIEKELARVVPPSIQALISEAEARMEKKLEQVHQIMQQRDLRSQGDSRTLFFNSLVHEWDSTTALPKAFKGTMGQFRGALREIEKQEEAEITPLKVWNP